ncbi:peptidoglycan editing factor PgeF [Hoeflea sp.]|uniref:peptidoglycan editing factor PgeF n=1 Tax=Hoeflea sp. TaxID=1940281 RepID=UPI0019BA69C9|nr:peptidoglycan editing factor PgeF [Hoeflea sp.]MBC7281364.1 peptidoglycan editing factor PgeF [Hoeflea sp.]
MKVDGHAPDPVRSALLDAVSAGSGISHGFFSRSGGVSEGLYRGLNVGLGSNDNRDHVMENRARVSRWFGLESDRLVTVHQVHSPRVHIATADNRGERPEADAIVTSTPGLALGVLSADCGPVLFCDPEARVIGAAHAGWRGAFDGVLESTVAAMQGLGARPDRISAVLGPSISQTSYEVGPEFVDRFVTADPAHEAYFLASPKPGHAMFDLRRFTLDRLRSAGLKADMLADCTYADEEAWFSYRRATHRNEPDYGRQISAIAIKEEPHGPAF